MKIIKIWIIVLFLAGISSQMRAELTPQSPTITFVNNTGDEFNYVRFKIQLNGENTMTEKNFDQMGCTRGSVVVEGEMGDTVTFNALDAIKKARDVSEGTAGKKIKEETGERFKIAEYMADLENVEINVMAFVAYDEEHKLKAKVSVKPDGASNKCDAAGLTDSFYVLSKESEDKYVLKSGNSAEELIHTSSCKRKKKKK